jgi:putative phosphoribosyl transferase
MKTQDSNSGPRERSVEIPDGPRRVRGTLSLQAEPAAVVVFAHGSGSGRSSPRNQLVARELLNAGLATLLVDLLEEDEAQERRKVLDVELLADRLGAATHWLSRDPETRGLRLGYFGASTGAAAALVAAAQLPKSVGAVVSRGGRPDLANDALPDVVAPTLLIVGGRDETVLELNRQALQLLRCPSELIVLPGATHHFPEPGALEEVARLAGRWFLRHLAAAPRSSRRRPGKAAVATEEMLGEPSPRPDGTCNHETQAH